MARVLVIDDQPHVRMALAIALRARGFEVVVAEDGASSLRQFKSSHFDLAIVDIYMPGLDGIKLIKILREHSPNLPVVAMSGVMLNASGTMALDYLPELPSLSKVACLKKPFSSADLATAVQAAMAAAA
jgi:CheY-like chemotaxis protein